MSAWWFVFRKELRETLRDRRTLLVMLAVPVLLYPVLMVASEQLLLFGMRQLDEEAAPVAVLGDAPSDLLWILDSIPTLRVVPPPAVGGSAPRSTMEESIREALTEGSVAAVVVLEGPTDGFGSREVRVYYSDASDRSRRGRSELMGAVDLWGGRLLEERLRVQGLPRSFVVPVAVADTSLALPEEVGGYALGRMLPMLLIVITLLGTFYPAIDLAAGEKERGTLEALLTTPVPPGAVVTGKFVTVALVGVVAAALNLLSMLLTFRTGLFRLAAEAGMVAAIAPATVALIFLTLIPLAVLFGALFLGISVRTASFKEAQNSLTPVYMLVMIPALLPVFPGIDLTPLLAVTPVAGVALFFRDLMSGVADPLMGAVVLVSSGVYAVLALRFAARNFGREDVLFPASRAPRSRRRPRGLGPVAALVNASGSGIPGERAAAGFIAVVAVLFFYGGRPLQIGFGETGILLSEWLLLALPALLFVRVGRFDAYSTLRLGRPSPRALAGALALVLGCMPIAWGIAWLQSFLFPVPWELLEGLEELVTADSATRLAWLLALLALTPAVCEELVFRGVLLGGTTSLSPRRAILLNGLVFGAFHLSFETAIRFLPTAWLGVVIAYAVWRSGSLWAGVLIHFVNNGTVVILASTPALRDLFADPQAPPPWWTMPAAVAFLLVGYRILEDLPAPVDIRTAFDGGAEAPPPLDP